MTRYSTGLAAAILGLGFAQSCTLEKPDDDDSEPDASTTGGLQPGTTGGSGGTTGSGTGAATSTAGGGTGAGATNGGVTKIPFEEACTHLAAQFEAERGADCGSSGENATPKQVNMLIVLDRSGSMEEDQKWVEMKNALRSALSTVQDQVNFGLELYPTPALAGDVIDRMNCGRVGNCCEMPTHSDMNVPIGSGATAVNTILETLDATEPGGGTPTTRALERALEYYTTGAGRDLEGDKYVLLATDGGPNCNEELACGVDLCTHNLDDPLRDCLATSADNNCCAGSGIGCVDAANVVDRIQTLAQNKIGTFVVGIPGSEAYSSFLNDFAEAGGRPSGDTGFSYYRVDDVAELTSVFERITIQLVTSCNLETASVPKVSPVVVIDCEEIEREPGAGGQSGNSESNWEWEPGTNQITLVGETCERVQQGVERIDVLLECEVIK